jgi:hypothetical protein
MVENVHAQICPNLLEVETNPLMMAVMSSRLENQAAMPLLKAGKCGAATEPSNSIQHEYNSEAINH